MGATVRMQYHEFRVNHGFSDFGQPAEPIGVFNGNEVFPQPAQTGERLASDHLKFSKQLAAVEHNIVFEPHAEVGNATHELVTESLPPRDQAQIGGERDQVLILPKSRKALE